MSMPKIIVRPGAALGPYRHQLQKRNGEPFDLTGCVVRGQVWSEDGDLAIELDVVVAADPTLGYYDFGLVAAKTAAMPAGAELQLSSGLELEDGRRVLLHHWRLDVQS